MIAKFTTDTTSIIMAGNPTRYISDTTRRLGRKLARDQVSLDVFRLARAIITTVVTIWESTVATAAPLSPRAGIPAHPNIKMGSKTTFKEMPNRDITIGIKVLPSP